jgi:hypothetical protein
MGTKRNSLITCCPRFPIEPADVVPQYDFVDSVGKPRRIDFMIVNPEKGYLLPIELDGKKKTENEDWNDFLKRQNALIRSFGTLLRYTNLQMLNNPQAIISEISKELAGQATRHLVIQAGQRKADGQPKTLVEKIKGARPTVPLIATSTSDGVLGGVTVTNIGNPWMKQEDSKPEPLADTNTRSPQVDVPLSLNPITLEPTSHSSKPAGRAIAVSFTLIGVAILGFAIWRNGSSHNVALQRQSTFTASLGAGTTAQVSSAAPVSAPPRDHISPSQAQAYVGRYKVVCGQVASTRRIEAGLFINFDRPYPNEAMAAVIWRQHVENIARDGFRDGQQLCVAGTIQTFRGKPQIEIERHEQILP